MEEDDDLYAKLYGEEAPKEAASFKVEELAAEPRVAETTQLAEPTEQYTAEPVQAGRLPDAYIVGQTTEQVSTFDDDDDDLEIRLDKLEPPDPDEEDELEIKLDDKKEPAAVPNGQPAPPPGISSVNKYVRPGSAQAVADRKPSQPLSQPMKDEPKPAPPTAAPPPGLQASRRPPTFPKLDAAYDPSDPGVLPSQASAKGQRVRLPGQTRVTPEEYKEFLGLGHGDIFHLDIDSVIDAPWYQPSSDPADFFNYGLNPRTWKEYCEAVKKYQTEFTMQRQIEVYDRDGRAKTGQQDMPPELAAAVAQRRAAEGHHRPAERDRASNGQAAIGYQERRIGSGPGQRALPYSKWHGQEGSQPAAAARPNSERGLPLPPFAALDWSGHSERQGSQQDDSLLQSKRRKMEAG